MSICMGVHVRVTEKGFGLTLEVARMKNTGELKQTLALLVNCHRMMVMNPGPRELTADMEANIYRHPLLNSLNLIKYGSTRSNGGTSKGL